MKCGPIIKCAHGNSAQRTIRLYVGCPSRAVTSDRQHNERCSNGQRQLSPLATSPPILRGNRALAGDRRDANGAVLEQRTSTNRTWAEGAHHLSLTNAMFTNKLNDCALSCNRCRPQNSCEHLKSSGHSSHSSVREGMDERPH